MESKSKNKQRFYAINPVGEVYVPRPTERGCGVVGEMVDWGVRNAYPHYLVELYGSCATLKSCVDGCTDYVCGDGVRLEGVKCGRGWDAAELARRAAFDYWLFGGWAWQVFTNADGVAVIQPVDMRYLRSDAERETFFYSERFGASRRGWTKSWEVQKYVAWNASLPVGTESVFCVWGTGFDVYPVASYASALESCEVEREISRYHLASIKNGFVGSYIVNFNNGVPVSDEVCEEVERAFSEKFTGANNGARVLFSWNSSKDTETTLQRLEVDDYGERFASLAERSRQDIFTAFRAHPNLFGIPTEGTGFAGEEYEEVFRLFNRTRIRPVQRRVADAVRRLGGNLEFVPFSMEGAE